MTKKEALPKQGMRFVMLLVVLVHALGAHNAQSREPNTE
jgi:hypothetical protein